MFTRFIAVIIFIALAGNAHADGCNLKNLDFGISQEKLKESLKLDTLDVATTGDASIISGAREICKEMPQDAVVELGLIDDKFVQMRIINAGSANELFTYATTVFGERDNKDPKEKAGAKVKLGLWSGDKAYSVVYTVYNAGGHEFERLVITSSNYKKLFESVNQAKSKAADDYLKENKRGKYSPTSKDSLDGNADAMKDSSGDNNPLKEKVLKENENTRGYHYK